MPPRGWPRTHGKNGASRGPRRPSPRHPASESPTADLLQGDRDSPPLSFGDTILNFPETASRHATGPGVSRLGDRLRRMARMARVVIPGVPHHVTQRGNRRQPTFFHESDYEHYKALLGEWCASRGVEVWAYCLMPNHVHLIVVPSTETALRAAIAEVHRRYTVVVNEREGWRGCLWQGRFASFPMAPGHLFNAVRYVELNPVRAALVSKAEEWRHSSARALLAGCRDGLVEPSALGQFGDWGRFLSAGLSRDSVQVIRRHERTGRPLGDRVFVGQLEASVGRCLSRRKPGPKPGTGGRPPRQRRLPTEGDAAEPAQRGGRQS